MEYVERNLTPQGNPIIQIGFFKTQSPSCWISQTYEHVELRFSDGTTTSITRDPGRVHYDASRLLSNRNYSCFFQVVLDPETENYMQKLAARYANSEDCRFSYMAMLWNFAPITRNFPIDGLFCSQYVTVLLNAAELASDCPPKTTSPDDLFNSLRKDARCTASYNRCLFTSPK